jgi:hypothetical protein
MGSYANKNYGGKGVKVGKLQQDYLGNAVEFL